MSAEKRLRLDDDVRRGDSKKMAIDLTEDMEEDATETAVPAVKDTLPLEEESSSPEEFDCEYDTGCITQCHGFIIHEAITGFCQGCPFSHWYTMTEDGDRDYCKLLRIT